ncbi:DUF3040 domain-containing protein [Protaetiibacter mangrovi]|uniref:DUF3040 domain-containing protein n=1 Tax=Protaetiibacter mangrovi TaxID=2970926 RepID=A0ABT1ZB85_9MICO|nr:DUF3040 domain-containing protein [Protaetiibacter mangrovi]MCS0497956.1 DUF3040 domain-containing protein [Protaetiibacter mangrovi]TPX02768.1 DUF3040 domain-containing protein [Schumannella luteola]
MPLSEQEQRLLDEMERNLYHSEAEDVTTVGARRGRANGTAIVLAAVGILIGLGLLLTGVVVRQPLVGVLGFAAMFAGVVLVVAPPLRFTVPSSPRPRR